MAQQQRAFDFWLRPDGQGRIYLDPPSPLSLVSTIVPRAPPIISSIYIYSNDLVYDRGTDRVMKESWIARKKAMMVGQKEVGNENRIRAYRTLTCSTRYVEKDGEIWLRREGGEKGKDA